MKHGMKIACLTYIVGVTLIAMAVNMVAGLYGALLVIGIGVIVLAVVFACNSL